MVHSAQSAQGRARLRPNAEALVRQMVEEDEQRQLEAVKMELRRRSLLGASPEPMLPTPMPTPAVTFVPPPPTSPIFGSPSHAPRPSEDMGRGAVGPSSDVNQWEICQEVSRFGLVLQVDCGTQPTPVPLWHEIVCLRLRGAAI